MSLFNGLFSGLLRAHAQLNDPFRVVETNAEEYDCYSPVCHDDCLVLYKAGENETMKLDIVFQMHIMHSTKKVFSLYRTSDEIHAQMIYCQMRDKLPVLVECFPEIGTSKSSLQDISQVIRQHPTWSATHIAAHFGCIKNHQSDMVKNKLVLRQLNDVCSDTLETPLHVAVKAQQTASVNALLNMDCRIDITDSSGNTALHYAAETTKEVIQALTSRSITAIINLKNTSGRTALHLACMADKPDCVMELLRAGADVNVIAEISDSYDPCDGIDIDMPDSATSMKSMKDVVDSRSNQFYLHDIKNGGTPLHWAKTKELIEMLLEYGCNVNTPNFNGDTALHLMIQNNRLACVVTLLSHHANVDIQNADGNTPLHIAVRHSDITFVHMLIVFGVNVNCLNNRGESARHIVGQEKRQGYAEMLYALHIVGSDRCPKSMYSCTDGCTHGGQFNGIPPDKSNISTDQSELFDELISSMGANYFAKPCSVDSGSGSCDLDKRGRVLSLDGGGIRGLVLIQLLYEMEQVVGFPIIDCFDWVCGTSTGGILALVLASGKSIKETKCIYFQLKDTVFVGARPYDSEALESILKRELGEKAVMTDIAYPKIMVTATRGDRKPAELHIFRNYPSPLSLIGREELDTIRNNTPLPKPKEQLIWHAARCTGAAPTYFRPCGAFLDGGLISNNPTLDALTEIHQCNQAHTVMGQEEEAFNISCLVSMGTGKPPQVAVNTIDVFRPDSIWSACRMALGVTAVGQLLIDQATQTDGRVTARASSLCNMLNIPYIRINPQLSESIALDETDDRILAKMLWETTAYMHSIRDKLENLATLIRP